MLKGGEITAFGGMIVGEIIDEGGVGKGVLKLVKGRGEVIGEGIR